MLAKLEVDTGRLRVNMSVGATTSEGKPETISQIGVLDLKRWVERSLVDCSQVRVQSGPARHSVVRVVPAASELDSGPDSRLVQVVERIEPGSEATQSVIWLATDQLRVGDILGVGIDVLGDSVLLMIDLDEWMPDGACETQSQQLELVSREQLES